MDKRIVENHKDVGQAILIIWTAVKGQTRYDLLKKEM
jgi:hypothetical protein